MMMMMMKGLMVDHDNMSNLTSASAEINVSASSSIRNESDGTTNLIYNQHSSASTNQLPPPPKRKRNLPGNPDPDAEVIALSPKTLLATNRFICEICNKGFQRDQNLQLHRRGHNLPWKLKQRTNNEVIRKKVYVCPESTCVHHDPSRALGDLTGIKKHFCRKHGEKKWKCEKCSKIYAVKSDWKAHSKICGTREYRCDCGTLFSRRDSFITHRAFCDALAQETNGRGITPIINHHPLLISSQPPGRLHSHGLQLQAPVKREEEVVHVPWQLAPAAPSPPLLFSSSSLEHSFIHHQNPNPSSTTRLLPPTTATASPHTSATALLQRATQMGAATISKTSPFLPVPHQAAAHMSEIMEDGRLFGNNIINKAAAPDSPSLLHDMIMMSSLSSAAASSYSYGDASTTTAGNFVEIPPNTRTSETQQLHTSIGVLGSSDIGGGNEGLTRDFLGLRAFPHRDFFDLVGLHHINHSSSAYGDQQNHNQSHEWHG